MPKLSTIEKLAIEYYRRAGKSPKYGFWSCGKEII
jgi:hypothetical protein